MSIEQHGFYTGYLYKSAEDTELSRRRAELEEFSKEDDGLPWSVRHPFFNALRGGVVGAGVGTLAGVGVGAGSGARTDHYSPEQGALVGGALGLPVGTLVGIALAMHRGAARIREADARLVRTV